MSSLLNTGVMTVMSGRCVPPLYGALRANTSPGLITSCLLAFTARTLSLIEPSELEREVRSQPVVLPSQRARMKNQAAL